jgi:hypothetical protein
MFSVEDFSSRKKTELRHGRDQTAIGQRRRVIDRRLLVFRAHHHG